MADVMRWRYGDTNPVVCAVDSGTAIEIGDMVYLDTDDVKPASSQADGGDEATNQETFKDNFCGVAMQRSASGDTDPIRVATSGVYEMDTASATYEVGDLVGADENSDGDGLLDQTVAAVADANYAIGIVAKRVSTAATKVLVQIKSTVMGEGVIAGTASVGD